MEAGSSKPLPERSQAVVTVSSKRSFVECGNKFVLAAVAKQIIAAQAAEPDAL